MVRSGGALSLLMGRRHCLLSAGAFIYAFGNLMSCDAPLPSNLHVWQTEGLRFIGPGISCFCRSPWVIRQTQSSANKIRLLFPQGLVFDVDLRLPSLVTGLKSYRNSNSFPCPKLPSNLNPTFIHFIFPPNVCHYLLLSKLHTRQST